MPQHQWSILEIADFYIHWLWQYARYLIPGVGPIAETGMPKWWKQYFTDADWYDNIRPNGEPRPVLMELAIRGCWLLLSDYVGEFATWARSEAIEWATAILGKLLSTYSTFSAWINSIDTRVGQFSFKWAADVAGAIAWLFTALPEKVRDQLQTWDQVFEGIKIAALAIVDALYAEARGYAYEVKKWLVETGAGIALWYATVNALVTDLHDNPYSFIVKVLGDTWTKLATFAEEALRFWFDLWGDNPKVIGELLRDPLGYLYDKAADYIAARW